jgi:hypothetical protein
LHLSQSVGGRSLLKKVGKGGGRDSLPDIVEEGRKRVFSSNFPHVRWKRKKRKKRKKIKEKLNSVRIGRSKSREEEEKQREVK